MKLRTETGTVIIDVHRSHTLGLSILAADSLEVGVTLTAAEAYILAGALIASAEEATVRGIAAERSNVHDHV